MVFIRSVQVHGLAHNDFKVVLFGAPIAHVTPVDANFKCPVRWGQEVPLAGAACNKAEEDINGWDYIVELPVDSSQLPSESGPPSSASQSRTPSRLDVLKIAVSGTWPTAQKERSIK